MERENNQEIFLLGTKGKRKFSVTEMLVGQEGQEDENEKMKKIKSTFQPEYNYEEKQIIINSYFTKEIKDIETLKREENILKKKLFDVMEEKKNIKKRLEERAKSLRTLQTAMRNFADTD